MNELSIPIFTITNLSIFIGFWVAFVHVLTGPDHLAAVTPIVLESKKKYWFVGFLWGLGHLLGMLLIGVLYLFFKEKIPIEKISEHSEQLVGVILVFLGFWSFFRIYYDKKKHIHPHIHKEEVEFIHTHMHDHELPDHKHSNVNQKDQKQWASFGVGIIHGFAGVAHFLLLLPVLGLSFNEALFYIIGFAVGTITAMTLFALIVGKITLFSHNHHKASIFKTIRLVGGTISICIGIYWMFW